MSDALSIAIAAGGGLLGGMALGALFFGGLWLTVRRLADGRGGGLFAAGSLLARLAMLAAGLVLAARLGPAVLLGCGAGLIGARALALRLARVGSLYPVTPDERTNA